MSRTSRWKSASIQTHLQPVAILRHVSQRRMATGIIHEGRPIRKFIGVSAVPEPKRHFRQVHVGLWLRRRASSEPAGIHSLGPLAGRAGPAGWWQGHVGPDRLGGIAGGSVVAAVAICCMSNGYGLTCCREGRSKARFLPSWGRSIIFILTSYGRSAKIAAARFSSCSPQLII